MDEIAGGELIGHGSYGCVFYPSLKCSKGSNDKGDKVSKIFFSETSHKEASREIEVNKLIKKIKGYHDWSHVWDIKCKPNKYKNIVKEDKDIKLCLKKNSVDESTFDKNSYMLQGSYGGTNISNVFLKLFTKKTFETKKTFTTNFLALIKLIKPLFIGLQAMNKNKVSHNDIKGDNIMVDSEGCKFIDFGLSAKYSDTTFFKKRTMSEYSSYRIYPPYPYEFIYMYAPEYLLLDEKSDINYGEYRNLHGRYELVHKTLFNRKNINKYLFDLMDRSINNKLNKSKIISLLDTYSLGFMFSYALCKICKIYKKLSEFKKYCKYEPVKSYMDLLKQMCEPDCENRMNPSDALHKYLELEKKFLKNDSKTKTKPKTAPKKRSKRTKKRSVRKA